MKKIIFLCLFLSLSLFAVAQDSNVKIALRLAPNLSFTGVTPEAGGYYDGSESAGTGFKIAFGPSFDFFFQENYAFSTGLWYNVKSSNVRFVQNPTAPEPQSTVESKYNLQYVTIPATIKLFTNEVADDLRIYFQVGGTIDIKLSEKNKNNVVFGTKPLYKPVNIGPYLGIGAELVISEANIAFAGLNYSRGILQTLTNNIEFDDNIKTQTSQFALEFGLKF
ncbi:MAG: PorT family protein [Verrucomicrobia bacterium]|nr:PorT family protein [Cytophagales bacterium]